MDTSPTYPKREAVFSNKFCRILNRCEVAQQIGAEACWLLTVIVMTEDARRYGSAVTFYNGQLQTQCGFESENRLNRHRQRAVEAGWLHYEPGGKSRPGTYWVTIPQHIEANDAPVHQADAPDLHLQNGGRNGGKTEGETGDKRRPSYLIPNPTSLNTSLPSKPPRSPCSPRSGRSGRGFDRKDLKDGEKILAYAKLRGIDTTQHELRIRCLAAALEAETGDKPGGLFVDLIDKGSRGDWSTVPDRHHEPAKRWLARIDRPASVIHPAAMSIGAGVGLATVELPRGSADEQAQKLREWAAKRPP